MADAFDTPFTPDPQQEQTVPEPQAAAPECCEDDGPVPLFGLGEVRAALKRWRDRETDAECEVDDILSAAQDLALQQCTSLDGIAAKLELVVDQQISSFTVSRLSGADAGWQLVELMAAVTAVTDLHRIRRLGAEAQP